MTTSARRNLNNSTAFNKIITKMTARELWWLSIKLFGVQNYRNLEVIAGCSERVGLDLYSVQELNKMLTIFKGSWKYVKYNCKWKRWSLEGVFRQYMAKTGELSSSHQNDSGTRDFVNQEKSMNMCLLKIKLPSKYQVF